MYNMNRIMCDDVRLAILYFNYIIMEWLKIGYLPMDELHNKARLRLRLKLESELSILLLRILLMPRLKSEGVCFYT